jgi:hypothetical protein
MLSKLKFKEEIQYRFFVFVVVGVLCCFEMGSCFVAQASLELTILLLQPPECWDCSCAPLCLARFFITIMFY